MLAFDAEAHRYTWDGRPVPSVTQVIRGALGDPFARISPAVLERKRRIGDAAHRAAELDAAGTLDDATVHPAVLPYLEAWRAFRRESQCTLIASESRIYHPVHGYAGTLDVFAWVNGDAAVIDIKTGLPGPQAELQLAAYAEVAIDGPEVSGGTVRRFALRVLPTGRYKFDEYKNPAAWRDFLACLAVHRLKEKIENE